MNRIAARLAIAACVLVTALIGAGIASANTITIQSGNGPMWGPDANVQITSVDNTGMAGICAAPNGTGPASVVAHPAYTVIPGTNYVGFNNTNCLGWLTVGGSGSTVYETTFTLPPGAGDVSLQLYTRSDNGIEISLNGSSISGNAHAYPNDPCGSSFYGPAYPDPLSFTATSGFAAGTNTLAFTVDNCNSAGSTALDFLGTITYTVAAPPVHVSPFAGSDGIGEDSGIALSGSPVTITATGSVNCGGPGCDFPPAGGSPGGSGFPLPGAPVFGLIARVGASGPWTFIGAGPTVLSGSGELYFGVNDDYYWDNFGPGFDVTVVHGGTLPDTTPPVLSGVPADMLVEATSLTGAPVSYTDPTAIDDFDGKVKVSCVPASGSPFAIGPTLVTCTATDAAGNSASASFTVTVNPLPVVKASLVSLSKGGDDESEQSFRVVFSATDPIGIKTVVATLNGVVVTNGQVVKLKLVKKGPQKAKRDDGKLQIEATSFLLTVTATDNLGGSTTETAAPVFVKKGKDDQNKGKGDNGKEKADH